MDGRPGLPGVAVESAAAATVAANIGLSTCGFKYAIFLFFQTLLDLGASPNYKNAAGLTPLYLAAMHGANPHCVELLLHDHATTGATDHQGWTEVHHVSTLRCWERVTGYCSLKPLWSGMGEVVPARTSLPLHPPSPPTVHQLS